MPYPEKSNYVVINYRNILSKKNNKYRRLILQRVHHLIKRPSVQHLHLHIEKNQFHLPINYLR